MIIDELSQQSWAVLRPTNYSTNGFPAYVPTLTPPSGAGVVPFGHSGAMSARGLLIVPYGAGAATNTFLIKVVGWRATNLGVGFPLWIPIQIGAWTATLGTQPGIVNSDVPATQLFADTILCTYGPTLNNAAAPNTIPPIIPDYASFSPTGNLTGMILVRSFGFRFLEVGFSTGGVATSANGLYSKI